IGRASLRQDGRYALWRCGIDACGRPVRRIDVAMLLPVEGVGLVEGDLVAPPGECREKAPIVGSGAVPIGGEQARAVEGHLHAATSADGARIWPTMPSNSSTRCLQVCRARMAAKPFAASD